MSDFKIMKRYEHYSVPYEFFLKYKLNESVEEALKFIFDKNEEANIILYENHCNIVFLFKLEIRTTENTEKENIVKVHEKNKFFRHVEKHGIFVACDGAGDDNTYYLCSICKEWFWLSKWDELIVANHKKTAKHRKAVKKIIN